jgi:hypothetical protein
VRQFGIKVVVIEPGGIESEWGNIAVKAAEDASGSGPYAHMVPKFAKTQNYKAPPATIVSDMVMRAIRASHPAPRYSGGLGARPMLFLRRILSDRMLDRLTMQIYR